MADDTDAAVMSARQVAEAAGQEQSTDWVEVSNVSLKALRWDHCGEVFSQSSSYYVRPPSPVGHHNEAFERSNPRVPTP